MLLTQIDLLPVEEDDHHVFNHVFNHHVGVLGPLERAMSQTHQAAPSANHCALPHQNTDHTHLLPISTSSPQTLKHSTHLCQLLGLVHTKDSSS